MAQLAVEIDPVGLHPAQGIANTPDPVANYRKDLFREPLPLVPYANHHLGTGVDGAKKRLQDCWVMLAISVHRYDDIAADLVCADKSGIQCSVVATVCRVANHGRTGSFCQLTRGIGGTIVNNNGHSVRNDTSDDAVNGR